MTQAFPDAVALVAAALDLTCAIPLWYNTSIGIEKGKHMEDTYNITIRIPADTATKLRELAEREHRSINAQIVVIIEKAIEQPRTEA
jgi:hypothetical protein